MQSLELTRGQLIEISGDFVSRIEDGLVEWSRQIRCMPTYVCPQDVQRDGRVAVLDLGGSNLRAGIVVVENGSWRLVERSETIKMPWQRGEAFNREELLDIQTGALSRLNWKDEMPLGYCFSYPAEPAEDGDVVLVKWAKGIDVPGTVGQKMGQMLLTHLNSRYPRLQCSGVTVINDTVAALIGGMADFATTDTIGLIAGTGNNMAAMLQPSDIPKLSADQTSLGLLPVNLESGNYAPPHLTHWDENVDRHSNNPGEQLLEKAVSGAYLGRIFKAVLPEAEIDDKQGGAGLVKILENPQEYPIQWVETASRVYFRSADLVAATLAGLIRLLHRLHGKTSIRVAAEGALFWGELGGKCLYRDRTADTLESLLSALDLGQHRVEFYHRKDTNLIGSAMAALA